MVILCFTDCTSLNSVPLRLSSIGVPYDVGDLKWDPSSENYPYGTLDQGFTRLSPRPPDPGCLFGSPDVMLLQVLSPRVEFRVCKGLGLRV